MSEVTGIVDRNWSVARPSQRRDRDHDVPFLSDAPHIYTLMECLETFMASVNEMRQTPSSHRGGLLEHDVLAVCRVDDKTRG